MCMSMCINDYTVDITYLRLGHWLAVTAIPQTGAYGQNPYLCFLLLGHNQIQDLQSRRDNNSLVNSVSITGNETKTEQNKHTAFTSKHIVSSCAEIR
jgi:hypothetical protein